MGRDVANAATAVMVAAETVQAESGASEVLLNNAGQMFMGLTETFSLGS